MDGASLKGMNRDGGGRGDQPNVEAMLKHLSLAYSEFYMLCDLCWE